MDGAKDDYVLAVGGAYQMIRYAHRSRGQIAGVSGLRVTAPLRQQRSPNGSRW